MVESLGSFQQLVEAARGGSAEAAHQLLNRYGRHILIAVRRLLHPRLRSLYDSTDFEQAVWASFFAADAGHRHFVTPEALAEFLVRVAEHKVKEEFRRRMKTAKHNMNRVKRLDELEEENAVPTRRSDGTPSQFAMAGEHWHRMIDGQPEVIRRMLELLRQGHSYEEIARQTGLNAKAIQRHMRKLREEQVS